MIKENKTTAWILGLLFLLSAAIYLLPFPFLIDSHFNQVMYLIMASTPFLAASYVLKLYGLNSVQGKIFIWVSLAFLCLFIGEFIWTVFIFMGIDPFPSLADYFYILFYPLLFVALMKEIKASQMEWKIKGNFTKSILIALGFILIALVAYFGVYVAYDPRADFLNNVVAMAYGVGDLILIFLAFFILKMAEEFKGGRIFFAWLTFAIALFITLMADIGFAMFNSIYEEGVLWSIRSMDLLWISSFLFFTHTFCSLGHIIKRAQEKVKGHKDLT